MEAGQRIRDRYELLEPLGSTKSAVTWLARDANTRLDCVIKEVSLAGAVTLKTVELFEREAAALRRLDHPRIPKYIDFFNVTIDGDVKFYLVQSRAPGRNLRQWMESGRRFTEAEAVGIGAQVAEALAYLHAQNPPLIHRDIKPSNIMLDEAGQVSLIDFGAVTGLESAADGSLPNAMTLVGTYGFMAYEQTTGQPLPASDVYSVGATLINLLSRRDPSLLLTPEHGLAFREHVNVGPHCADVLDVCVQPNPERRYPDGEALLDDLRRLLAGKRPRGPRKTAKILWVAMTLLLSAGVVLGGVNTWKRNHPARQHDFTEGGLRRALSPGVNESIGGFSARPTGLAFDPNGRWLAAVEWDRLHVLDTADWSRVVDTEFDLPGESTSLSRRIAFSSGGTLAVAAHHFDKGGKYFKTATLHLYSGEAWSSPEEYELAEGKVSGLSWHPAGDLMVVGINNYNSEWEREEAGQLCLYDAGGSYQGAMMIDEDLRLFDVDFSPDGTEIACLAGIDGDRDHRLLFFLAYPGLAELRRCDAPDSADSFSWFPDGSGGVADEFITQRFWYYSGETNAFYISPNARIEDEQFSYNCFGPSAVSGDGNVVAASESAYYNNDRSLQFISLYSAPEGRFLQWMELKDDILNPLVCSIAFSPDKRWLVAGYGNDFKGSIAVWNFEELLKRGRD